MPFPPPQFVWLVVFTSSTNTCPLPLPSLCGWWCSPPVLSHALPHPPPQFVWLVVFTSSTNTYPPSLPLPSLCGWWCSSPQCCWGWTWGWQWASAAPFSSSSSGPYCEWEPECSVERRRGRVKGHLLILDCCI